MSMNALILTQCYASVFLLVLDSVVIYSFHVFTLRNLWKARWKNGGIEPPLILIYPPGWRCDVCRTGGPVGRLTLHRSPACPAATDRVERKRERGEEGTGARVSHRCSHNWDICRHGQLETISELCGQLQVLYALNLLFTFWNLLLINLSSFS